MNRVTRQGQYLLLVERFLSGDLAATSFCAEFTALWVQDRDDAYAQKANWPQPYDELLLAAWQHGEVSESEFRSESAKLWGYAEEIEFRTMVNEIHSACSVFSPSPELQWEIDTDQLKHTVQASLVRYEAVHEPVTATRTKR